MVFSNYGAKFYVMIVCAVFLLTSDLVLAKSRTPISDAETRQKKNDCYADIESGLWGEQCTSSTIAKENCALRCLSPICYELIYESDPLEEGEKDFTRSSEYKYCMHRDNKSKLELFDKMNEKLRTEKSELQNVKSALGISWRKLRWH